jgi:hypothetical protein
VFIWCVVWSMAAGQGALEAVYAPLPAHPLESRLLWLTNDERIRSGVRSVAQSDALALAARHHAMEMASMNYFSHTSPVDRHATPQRRVANAGSAAVRVGENISLHGRMALDLPERVVQGWMESPGHRQNLLHASWTHVGFGAHVHTDGRVYVVQLFSEDPNPIEFAHASPGSTSSLSLRFEVASDAGGFIVVSQGPGGAVTMPVTGGSRVWVTLAGVSASSRTHVSLGWRRDGSSGAIGQASGWFDPDSQRITPDYQNASATSRFLSYAAGSPVRDIVVQLAFAFSARDMVIIVDDHRVHPETIGTNARFSLPGGSAVVPIDVGMDQGDGRVRIIHQFIVENRGGRLVVAPVYR